MTDWSQYSLIIESEQRKYREAMNDRKLDEAEIALNAIQRAAVEGIMFICRERRNKLVAKLDVKHWWSRWI